MSGWHTAFVKASNQVNRALLAQWLSSCYLLLVAVSAPAAGAAASLHALFHASSRAVHQPLSEVALPLLSNSTVCCHGPPSCDHVQPTVKAPSAFDRPVHDPLPLIEALQLCQVLLHACFGHTLCISVQGLQVLLPQRLLCLLLLSHAPLRQCL